MLTDQQLDHAIVHGLRDEMDFRRIVASHRDALDRLRIGEALLAEVLRLGRHLEKAKGETILTLSHENRIREFLCLLPRGSDEKTADSTVPEHSRIRSEN